MKAAPLHWLLGRLPYRVRQFTLAALAPVAPAEVEGALRQAGLPAPAARLFRAMPRPYRRHALNVAARLTAEGVEDCIRSRPPCCTTWVSGTPPQACASMWSTARLPPCCN